MRLEKENPQNPVEQKIEDLLIASGHKQDEIQFRGGEWSEHTQSFSTRYLRYSYWQNIKVAEDSEIWNYVSLDTDWDDDCGELYLFPFKNEYQPTKNSK
jgi:hypothetical protein